jgi:phage-related protein
LRDDRKLIGEAIRTVEDTGPVPPPLVKKLDAYMWEIRETISNRNEARLIFIVDSGFCVLLHGFEKKSRKTSQQDLETADSRRKDYNRQKELAAMTPKKERP